MKVKIINEILKFRSRFLLRKLKNVSVSEQHILGFSTVKDEIHLIESSIQHYRNIGCDRFIILDNGSTDGTLEYLLDQPDVIVYTTTEKYKYRPNGLSSKKRWMTLLLNKYGKNRWCIGFDADELLLYPNSEKISLKDVVHYLEVNDYNALKCQWIDMYSDKPVAQTDFKSGSLIDACQYYDKDCKEVSAVERVFGWRSEFDKTPLFKWSSEVSIENGWHRIHGRVNYADFKGLSLHFPFSKNLLGKAKTQAESGQYYLGGAKYKKFNELFSKNRMISLRHENSEKFISTQKLYSSGFITISKKAKKSFEII